MTAVACSEGVGAFLHPGEGVPPKKICFSNDLEISWLVGRLALLCFCVNDANEVAEDSPLARFFRMCHVYFFKIQVSAHFGFKDECKAKYGLTVYYRFLLAFQVCPSPYSKTEVTCVLARGASRWATMLTFQV